MSQCSLVILIKQFPSLLIVMRGIVYGQHVKNEFFIFFDQMFLLLLTINMVCKRVYFIAIEADTMRMVSVYLSDFEIIIA